MNLQFSNERFPPQAPTQGLIFGEVPVNQSVTSKELSNITPLTFTVEGFAFDWCPIPATITLEPAASMVIFLPPVTSTISLYVPVARLITSQNNDVLTEKEITKLHDIYDSGKYSKGKQEVLRTFLFSCYTSLSFAEFSIVTYADLKEYIIDGKVCLLLCNERKKNNIPYKIPIVSDRVKQLLGKGESFQKIFTPLGNQPTNRYLKDIMKDAPINKEMTFHRARHSFRTITAQKGIRDSIAERIMGHAESNDIKDIYTHLSNKDIIREMLNKWIAI